eukprot:m.120265 g.120265  ORF g.120265 m.120265 type:complete len:55 (-) comp15608_c0_seq7:758-922(-)
MSKTTLIADLSCMEITSCPVQQRHRAITHGRHLEPRGNYSPEPCPACTLEILMC